VAAWERHAASFRGNEIYDVPFDEDPMQKVGAKSGVFDKQLARVVPQIPTPIERIEEIPFDDNIDSSKPKELIVETSNLQVDSIALPTTDSTIITVERVPTVGGVHTITTMTNLSLFDQEEELEIHAAPSDETRFVAEANNDEREVPSATAQRTGIETFACPDAICTQVSKLWR
jgi:hypothetical protein